MHTDSLGPPPQEPLPDSPACFMVSSAWSTLRVATRAVKASVALAKGAEFPMRALFSSSAAALRRARLLLCSSFCWRSSGGAGSD